MLKICLLFKKDQIWIQKVFLLTYVNTIIINKLNQKEVEKAVICHKIVNIAGVF